LPGAALLLTSDKAITGVSTYNVTPDKAAYYFNKIQCFCFEEQRLQPREVVDMPVFFYIDPELVDDFNCRWVGGKVDAWVGGFLVVWFCTLRVFSSGPACLA
jgi:hypothetical protein